MLVFRHYKDGLFYGLDGYAEDHETGNVVMLYHEIGSGKQLVREQNEFFADVPVNGEYVHRFTLVGEVKTEMDAVRKFVQ